MKYIIITIILLFSFVSVKADVDVQAVKKQIEMLKKKPRGAFFGKRQLKKKLDRKIQALENSIKGL